MFPEMLNLNVFVFQRISKREGAVELYQLEFKSQEPTQQPTL